MNAGEPRGLERDAVARFVVVASHPIQYYAPFYRALAARTNMHVHAIFGARIGLEKMRDTEMGVDVAWAMDLLGGYSHEFLPEAAKIKRTGFREVDNPSVGAALARARPDVVLLHGYANKTMLRALAWCRRNGVPAMMISDSSLHIGTGSSARLAKRIALPLLMSQFSAFLSIGDANKRYLETFGVPASRIHRVPNMVDEGFWAFRARRDAERIERRRSLGLTDDDIAVLFVGKMIPRKRPGDILAALERIKATGGPATRIKALFAGNGELLASLRATAVAKGLPAQFLGFINVDELPGIYCAADALVHPAELETFGVIVLEAAILGLPLVLSDRVGALGPTSVAREGENALVHAAGDVGGLAEALTRLASDAELRARLGAASLEISKEHDGGVSVGGTVAAVEHCLKRRITNAPAAA